MNTNQFLILILLCHLAIVWIRQWARDRIQAEAAPKPKTPRPLKPKTAEDCPFCRAEKEKREDPQPKQPLKPWSEVNSPRGRKKTLSTKGHSCPNPTSTYFGIIDESVHALVGYGRHGKTDRIQDLRYQACGRKISVRWGTALYRLKISSTKVALILALMADGVDVSALERVFGIREGTLRAWLTRAGMQAGKVHRHFFHHLLLHHLQLDELWAQVRQGGQVGFEGYAGPQSFICGIPAEKGSKTDDYGVPRGPYPDHSGIDYGTCQQYDVPVIAPMGGRVAFAGWSSAGYGNLLVIENNGWQIYLGHNNSFLVGVGDVVRAGEAVALSGSTGNSSRPYDQ